ncbi:MAG: hypothetical protein ACRCU1_00370 [Alsobacter sp.]
MSGVGVRRGGGVGRFSPAALGASLFAWYRATDVVIATGVQTMTDLSGNSRDITQGNASFRPAHTPSNANFAGQPTVDFDGTADRLAIAAQTFTEWTIWVACRPTTMRMLVSHGAAGSDSYLFDTVRTIRVEKSAVISSYDAPAGWAGVTTCGIEWVYPGTHAGHTVTRNGAAPSMAAVDVGVPGAAGVSGTLTLGSRSDGTLPFAGAVAEMIVAMGALTAAQRLQVRQYMASRYGYVTT